MYTSDIVARAKSLADLQSTDFITFQDKFFSLNESYRNVYSEITESNDDYFLKEEIISITPADLVQQGNNFEYQIALPADFYKLRYLDYRSQGAWQPVNKFSLSNRDANPGGLMYRWRGEKLWLIGGFSTSGGEIRLGYYPPQEVLNFPDTAITYLSTLPVYDGLRITPSSYVDASKTLVYIEAPGTNYLIKAENATTKVTSTLYTSATAVSNVVYYKGYIYLITSTGNIQRATTNLTSTIVPANIIATANVVGFTIWNDKIYFRTSATELRSCNLDGTGSAVVSASAWTCYYPISAGNFYISAGEIFRSGTASGITGVLSLHTDGVYIYAMGTDGVLTKYTTDFLQSWALAYGVDFIGPVDAQRLPVNVEGVAFLALSAYQDSNLDYPLNMVPEIMAYQSAIDFRRKQNADTTALKDRLGEMWLTFRETIRRDDYQVERVRNYYQSGGSVFGGTM